QVAMGGSGARLVRRVVGSRAALAAVAIGMAVAAFLLGPGAWARTTLEAPVNGIFPGAGPSFIAGLSGPGRPASGNSLLPLVRAFGAGGGVPQGPPVLHSGLSTTGAAIEEALIYAARHQPGRRFRLIVSNE